jgi:hypothetical protein
MASRWHVVRNLVPQPDGQRRWDYAYQCLIGWTSELGNAAKLTSTSDQEKSNGNRPVCPSIDQSPTTGSDH